MKKALAHEGIEPGSPDSKSAALLTELQHFIRKFSNIWVLIHLLNFHEIGTKTNEIEAIIGILIIFFRELIEIWQNARFLIKTCDFNYWYLMFSFK